MIDLATWDLGASTWILSLFISVKNGSGILSALTLSLDFGRMAIFITLILLINEHSRSLHLLVSY